MNRERMDRWCERGILGMVISILFFGTLAYGAVRISEFAIVQLLVVAIILLWIFRLWINPRPIFFWPPICWAVLAFVIYAIVRHNIAAIEYPARLELLKVLTYAFLFVAIINNLSRQESTQIVSIALIILGFALSIFAVFQFITHYDQIWTMTKTGGYVSRGSGTFNNPNSFAGFAEMILPVALAYTLISRFSHVKKVLFGYASLAIVVAIGVSLSRGGWIATALMLVIFLIVLLFQRDFRLRSLILLALLLVIGIGVVAKANQSQKRFEELMAVQETKDERFSYWNTAVKMWREDIWLGAGPAHFDFRYRQFRPEAVQSRPEFVHNDYLNTLADWGIVGLALVLGFLVFFFIGVFKTWPFVQRSPNDLGTKASNKAALVLGGSLGIVALFFHSFVDFNMHVPANALIAFTLIALVTTYIRFATEKFWASLGFAGKISLTLIGLAGMIFLEQQTVRQFREDRLLTLAAAEEDFSEKKLNLLKQAFAIEPKNFETADAIGEILRGLSTIGRRDADAFAQDAMLWFQRSIALNPFYPFSYLHKGMCLDWLGQNEEAGKYFAQARKLDPNGYYTTAYEGWHLMQLGDYVGAKKEFDRSEHLMPNTIAESYQEIVEQKLAEQSTK